MRVKRVLRWITLKFISWVCWPINYCIILPISAMFKYLDIDDYTIIESIKDAHNELMDEYREA